MDWRSGIEEAAHEPKFFSSLSRKASDKPAWLFHGVLRATNVGHYGADFCAKPSGVVQIGQVTSFLQPDFSLT